MQDLQKVCLSLDQQAQQEEERGFCDKTFQVSNLSSWSSRRSYLPHVVTVLC